jgi:hypothetical protein
LRIYLSPGWKVQRAGAGCCDGLRKTLMAIITAAAILCTGMAGAAGTAANEYAIKAAYIYNILRFVHWDDGDPLSKTATLNICLAQDKPEASFLEPITHKTISNKPVRLVKMNAQTEPPLCHIVFLQNSDLEHADISRYQDNDGTIVLGNERKTSGDRAMFSFFIENNKVRLGANRMVMESKNIHISAMLIEVCQLYGDDNGSD